MGYEIIKSETVPFAKVNRRQFCFINRPIVRRLILFGIMRGVFSTKTWTPKKSC